MGNYNLSLDNFWICIQTQLKVSENSQLALIFVLLCLAGLELRGRSCLRFSGGGENPKAAKGEPSIPTPHTAVARALGALLQTEA